MDISADQVRDALLWLIAFVVSVSVHEFGHAFVADRLGDRIPRLQGRLTLSPAAHIDPIGTILMPLLGALVPPPMLAWGKPVQTSPNNYTRALSYRPVKRWWRWRAGHDLLLALPGSVIFLGLGRPVAVAGPATPCATCSAQHHADVLQLDQSARGAAVLAGILPGRCSQSPTPSALRHDLFFITLLSGRCGS
jgi:H+/Cl- antiporter ClcA